MSENNLTYINEDGDTVFTSAYLKNRGTCCKTDCLHCPYGFNLKSNFIEVVELKQVHIKFANEIIRETSPVEVSDVSMSLLASAFGSKEKIRVHHITVDNFSNFAFAEFKNTICGVIEFSTRLSESSSGRLVKELFLKKEFSDQGLGIEHIK